MEKFELKEKIISYSGDYIFTNFGGIMRKGKNNIFIKFKNALYRDILGLGCYAHIVYNGVQCVADSLPILLLNLQFTKYSGFFIYLLLYCVY